MSLPGVREQLAKRKNVRLSGRISTALGPSSNVCSPGGPKSKGLQMRRFVIQLGAALAMGVACSGAVAQTPLSAYVDSNGFIDVQTLTCAQLAGTYQEDADALTTWYSG